MEKEPRAGRVRPRGQGRGRGRPRGRGRGRGKSSSQPIPAKSQMLDGEGDSEFKEVARFWTIQVHSSCVLDFKATFCTFLGQKGGILYVFGQKLTFWIKSVYVLGPNVCTFFGQEVSIDLDKRCSFF